MKSIRGSYLWLDVIVTMAIMSIYGSSYCPDVNESHYMTKAKNFWDASFCPGDLFLESGDAHWFFFVTFGLATKFTSLPVATWIGRWICWFGLACGWCRLARSLAPIRLIGAFSSLLLIASIHYGQLSGEWVIGGCEAKCMAYAFAFLGLAAAIRSDWSWAWIHFGIACAFHVITGGWFALALISAIVCKTIANRWLPSLSKRFMIFYDATSNTHEESQDAVHPSIPKTPRRSQLYFTTSVMIGIAFVLVGLIPALMLNRNVDVATAEKGTMIYVFARLPHHLRVFGFSEQRWIQHGILASFTIAFGVLSYFIGRYGRVVVDLPASQPSPLGIETRPVDLWQTASYGLLILTCLFGVVFAIAGACIDLALHDWAVNWSANLLRYYWFRWNDVAWPIALCTFILASVYRLSRMSYAQTWRQSAMLLCWTVMIVPGAIVCWNKLADINGVRIPPADFQSLIFANTSRFRAEQTYRDWQEACYWVRSATPKESLFLTPRNQQTFKWYAQRAEVVCWKDSPQNAKDLVEWHRRLHLVFATDTDGGPMLMNQVRAIQLAREFKFNYIVLDRRSDPTPLALPIVYENETFAIFQMLDL